MSTGSIGRNGGSFDRIEVLNLKMDSEGELESRYTTDTSTPPERKLQARALEIARALACSGL